MTCRQYTCGNCWNEAEGRCLSCAPHLGHEILPAPFPDLDPATVAIGDANGDANGAEGTTAPTAHARGPAGGSLAWPTMRPAIAGRRRRPTTRAVDAAAIGRRMPSSSAIPDGRCDRPPEPRSMPSPTDGEAGVETDARGRRSPRSWRAEPDAVRPRPLPTAAAPRPPLSRCRRGRPPTRPRLGRAGAPDVETGRRRRSTQTTDLMQRFRPGQSLDEAIEAYEREQASAAAPSRRGRVGRRAAEADAPNVDRRVAARPPPRGPRGIADEAELADRSRPSRRGDRRPSRPRARGGRAAAPEPPRRRVDVVEQPTWRIVAPEAERRRPTGDARRHATADQLPTPAAATAEPQWPTKPEWPSQRPAAAAALPGPPGAADRRPRGAVGRVGPRGRHAPTARRRRRRQRRRRRPAVRQLRAVTVRDRPVLPALRDPPGLSPPSARRGRAAVVADPDPGRAVQQRLERERQPGQGDERRRQRTGERSRARRAAARGSGTAGSARRSRCPRRPPAARSPATTASAAAAIR